MKIFFVSFIFMMMLSCGEDKTIQYREGAFYLLEDGFECDPYIAGDPTTKSWKDKITMTKDKEFYQHGPICNDYNLKIDLSESDIKNDQIEYEGNIYVFREQEPKFD